MTLAMNVMYQDSIRFYELHGSYADTLTVSRPILESLARQDETKQMYSLRNQMTIKQNIYLSEFDLLELIKTVLKVQTVNIINDDVGYTFSRSDEPSDRINKSTIPRSLAVRSKASASTIPCPNCHSKNISVLSTRASGNDIIRYKVCLDCQHRYKTIETISR